jgi:hypothetical protein
MSSCASERKEEKNSTYKVGDVADFFVRALHNAFLKTRHHADKLLEHSMLSPLPAMLIRRNVRDQGKRVLLLGKLVLRFVCKLSHTNYAVV